MLVISCPASHILFKFYVFIFKFYHLGWCDVGIPTQTDKIIIKLKYENIQLKKCNAGLAKLCDKIIKMPSKSHETIPLNTVG
jgi:hypothetical protein